MKEIATILEVSTILDTVHGTPSAPWNRELNACMEDFQSTSAMMLRNARQTS